MLIYAKLGVYGNTMEVVSPIFDVQKAHRLLKEIYGFDTFRTIQHDIIQAVTQGEDCLVLMPTGGGKSLCYQLPALLRPGFAVVVSPLIALMEDQVSGLKNIGIKAGYYNSTLDADEARSVLRQMHTNALQLLYIAPERLLNSHFIQRLQECDIALFAIDEAHCISQWGHDFRPEYTGLGTLKKTFPSTPIIALTATADGQTRQDIVHNLHFQPREFTASFNRPNIHYNVQDKLRPLRQLLEFIEENTDQSGIIYCSTRAKVDRLAEQLTEKGISCAPYHAGLPSTERQSTLERFRRDQVTIVVATIAFGMGIDKPNVRFVVHYDLPKSIENYYQETGRAGRDGLPSKALMLYDPADAGRIIGFIQSGQNLQQQAIEKAKLQHMITYAETHHCRRKLLLQYFDEPTVVECNYCDTCDTPPESEEVTTEARMFLSCVYRLDQSFGIQYVIDILRGSSSAKILQKKHDTLSTYGIGKHKSSRWWKKLAWHLILEGYCFQDHLNHQVLRLDKSAIPVLKGDRTIEMRKVQTQVPLGNQANHDNTDKEDPLFIKLRSLRKSIAEREDKPPFMIFSDASLLDMVQKKPTNALEFLKISGVGQHKMLHYSKEFLTCINNVISE